MAGDFFTTLKKRKSVSTIQYCVGFFKAAFFKIESL